MRLAAVLALLGCAAGAVDRLTADYNGLDIKRGDDAVPCANFHCEMRGTQTVIKGFKGSNEKWHCQDRGAGIGCKCTCHPDHHCTLVHDGPTGSIIAHHCDDDLHPNGGCPRGQAPIPNVYAGGREHACDVCGFQGKPPCKEGFVSWQKINSQGCIAHHVLDAKTQTCSKCGYHNKAPCEEGFGNPKRSYINGCEAGHVYWVQPDPMMALCKTCGWDGKAPCEDNHGRENMVLDEDGCEAGHTLAVEDGKPVCRRCGFGKRKACKVLSDDGDEDGCVRGHGKDADGNCGHCGYGGNVPCKAGNGWKADTKMDANGCYRGEGLYPGKEIYPKCMPHRGTVHAMCDGKSVKRWGIGTEGEAQAVKNCHYAAHYEKRWGACGREQDQCARCGVPNKTPCEVTATPADPAHPENHNGFINNGQVYNAQGCEGTLKPDYRGYCM